MLICLFWKCDWRISQSRAGRFLSSLPRRPAFKGRLKNTWNSRGHPPPCFFHESTSQLSVSTCPALPFRSGVNGSHWTPPGLSFSTSHSCPPPSHPLHCRADQATVLPATLLWLPTAFRINPKALNQGCQSPASSCSCHLTAPPHHTLCSHTLAFCQYLEHINLFPTYGTLHSLFPLLTLSSIELICIKESSVLKRG